MLEDKYRYPTLAVMIVLIVLAINYLEPESQPSEVGGVQVAGAVGYKAPEVIAGGEWFNSEPLSIRELEGEKVVLIDFWTYTCINCVHTIPFLKDWDDKYRDDGLVIIGVHAPEFGFEREPENVEAAIERLNVTWPVVQDNGFDTWRAYNNRNWPHKFLIDKDGIIRYHHIGEGAYDEGEEWIVKLLKELGRDVETKQSDIEERSYRSVTPELYVGSGRAGGLGNDAGYQTGPYDYIDPGADRQDDKFYLQGRWNIVDEYLQYAGEPDEGYIIIDFLGDSANLVMAPANEGNTFEVTVTLDGEYLTPDNAGEDILFDGERSYVLVDSNDLYRFVRTPYERHTLKLTVDSNEFRGFAFTFV